MTAIDKAKCEATLKGPDGATLTVKVGPEAVNFDQVQVGEKGVFQATETIAVDVTKR